MSAAEIFLWWSSLTVDMHNETATCLVKPDVLQGSSPIYPTKSSEEPMHEAYTIGSDTVTKPEITKDDLANVDLVSIMSKAISQHDASSNGLANVDWVQLLSTFASQFGSIQDSGVDV